MHNPVNTVFVVGCCEDMADDQFAAANHCAGVVSEIGVLEQDAGVLFVDLHAVSKKSTQPYGIGMSSKAPRRTQMAFLIV
jgi:hypothetical protein